ncbi:MAG: sigma-70 family RNA polymerase sigma factor [Bacteroidetes bacterium]|jgi:RNA polymerase sigma-70 factor (ECF subfamily)|nr:sigma-70 family RNA polymerase sigma factor [Bacteroidota bacterium]
MLNDELIQQCKAGDGRAQKKVYELTASKMMGVCLRYTKDEDEAKDLLQDGYIKVFQKIATYRGEGSLEGWIKKVIINTALENLRSKKLSFESFDNQYIDTSDTAVTNTKMEAKDLLKLIQSLPDGYRTVFNLFAIEGYSHQEIANQLGISAGTSKSQFARARQLLQKLLTEEKIK